MKSMSTEERLGEDTQDMKNKFLLRIHNVLQDLNKSGQNELLELIFQLTIFPVGLCMTEAKFIYRDSSGKYNQILNILNNIGLNKAVDHDESKYIDTE